PSARIRCLLARYYRKSGDLSQAESLALEAVERYRQLGQSEIRGLGVALNELAMALRRQGRQVECEEALAESLIYAEEEEHAGVHRAKTLESLATLAQERGDIARALHYRRQALEIKRATVGDSSLTYALSLCNLGVLELGFGQQREAEERFREAIGIYE